MSSNSIETTIQLTAEAFNKSVSLPDIKEILLQDGFLPYQVEVMVRWAKLKHLHNKTIEKLAANF